MKYLGGKARIAKELAAFIAGHHADRWLFVEPFMGGGSMTTALAPHFDAGFASDVVPDLALLYRAVQAGWQPPEVVSEAEYAAQRNATPSPLRAFVGFGCSFGGKWFGGYARGTKEHSDDYPGAARRKLFKLAAAARHVEFFPGSYIEAPVVPGAVVYCDPPYASTTGYQCGDFDHAKFWDTARAWRSAGAFVYVSEYSAPDDWRPVWEKDRMLGIRNAANSRSMSVERLFI